MGEQFFCAVSGRPPEVVSQRQAALAILVTRRGPIAGREQLKWQFLAAEKPELLLADDIDEIHTYSGNGAACHQSSPNLSPSNFRNADRVHGAIP
jgi:hypothetical protein